MRCRALIDAVGISGGGGREVVRDVTLSCLAEAGLHGLVLCTGDAGLVREFRDDDRILVVDVGQRPYAWRAWWWYSGAVRRARAHNCAAILHLANVATGRSYGLTRAVLIHQSNIFDSHTGAQLSFRARTRYRTLRYLVRATLRRVDVVFVQTTAVAEAVRTFDVPGTDVRVAAPSPPSSLPPARPAGAAPRCEQRTIVYIGSDAPHKNVTLLFQAAPRLAAAVPGGTFVLTISPDDTRKAGEGLLLVGSASRQDVANHLERALALVMPSLAETVGLPMLEAMQRGVPVLAADLAYARAVCEDAALYFDPGDPEDLVSVCRLVAEDSELRTRMIEKGRARLARLERDRGDDMMAAWLARSMRDRAPEPHD